MTRRRVATESATRLWLVNLFQYNNAVLLVWIDTGLGNNGRSIYEMISSESRQMIVLIKGVFCQSNRTEYSIRTENGHGKHCIIYYLIIKTRNGDVNQEWGQITIVSVALFMDNYHGRINTYGKRKNKEKHFKIKILFCQGPLFASYIWVLAVDNRRKRAI